MPATTPNLLTTSGAPCIAARKRFARELIAATPLPRFGYKRTIRGVLNVVREAADEQVFERTATPRQKRVAALKRELAWSFSTDPHRDRLSCLPRRLEIAAELERMRAEDQAPALARAA